MSLFATRVGAATIEMMKESYLFKQIDGGEINIIFISRNTYPLSYIIAPIIASAFLFVLPYQYLFIFLGLIVLSAIPLALALKDTR